MITFVIILFGMIVCYWGLNMIMHSLPEVEAGPISGIKGTGSRRISGNVAPAYRKTEANGLTYLHRNFIVKGKCMEHEGIMEGSVQDVRIFNKQESANLNRILKEKDIVLIYLNDNNFRGYKLRVVKKVMADSAETYYYVNDCVQESSCPHSFNNIIGIVTR